MPRTEKPQKRAIRFCGDCGYEFGPDSDGTCPMCPRFEQLRMDFTVPRPSELAAHRAEVRDTDVSAAPDEWPPTAAEYRAILEERQGGSTPADQSRGRVIRTPGLRQIRVAPPSGSASAADGEVLASPVPSRLPKQEPPPTPPKKAKGRKRKAKGRKRKDGGRRAARARARSPSAAEENSSPPTPSSSAPRTSADLPATDNSAAPPEGRGAKRAVAVASEPIPTPRQLARSSMHMHAAPVRRVESRSRAEATRSWPVAVAVVALSALIGAVVSILLSLP